jgi:hypothetical protein
MQKAESPMCCPRKRAEEMRAVIEKVETVIAGFRARQFDGLLNADEKSSWQGIQIELFQRRRDLAEAVRMASLCKSERRISTCETASCYSVKPLQEEMPSSSANDSAELEVPTWAKRGG